MDQLVQQESSNRPGVIGVPTRYGRAMGLAQVLPATGKAMAAKLGIGWRPDLMTGTSTAAAQYQRAIGQAYLDEGLAATGNLPDALRYYHGGPDRRQWGPKTDAYSRAILSRLER